jgi:signal transduction histidine kinase
MRRGSAVASVVALALATGTFTAAVIAVVRAERERARESLRSLAMEAEGERLRIAGEQERLQQRLQQSRRLESLGQLVGGVAHDFNNLLNVISGYADFTAEQLTSLAKEDDRLEPVLADVEQVRTAAQQAIRVTRQLLAFSKSETVDRQVLDVNEVVETARQLLCRSLGEQIDLVISAEPRERCPP